MRRSALLLLLLGASYGLTAQTPITEVQPQEEEEDGSGYRGQGLEGLPDTYWSGTAPLCFGGCKGRHRELKTDPCGNLDCCWIGYKSLCRVNCGKPDVDFNGVVHGNDWWVGSVVRYACRPGFILVGDPARACQSNGRWTAKPSCLRVCRQGRVEISERELDGSCTSSCPLKSYEGDPRQGCSRIDGCQKKESAWQRWFSKCDMCQCDCFVPCATAG
ncbi:sushi, von Willebrand factor type A, EGF and pentraxin domain-containing protein 1 isoform X2 [Denticeps clupeoides]|uniref:sushi, von Willebrand factor type A, EGF and pentraxin domain-containing protein 1 isoform X2 n=1 Tax=Denticeps clupeoides TaxID=299321 RepID=UPI0010A38CE9|nr:sushi, von Willebrand factor type A, EGF and pentraxin domain-containing protein 1-like isoform X2 [Denticeps clupeoides]